MTVHNWRLPENKMARCRCYFMGADGRLLGAENIESGSDDKAIAIAQEEFFQRAYARGFAVWQTDRLVYVRRAEAS